MSRIKGTLLNFWIAYGGIRALSRSPYLWLAHLMTLGVVAFGNARDWVDPSFNVIPSLLGFSIGAMAVVLAIPSISLFNIIAEDGHENSYYIDLSARFVNFIFVQVIALFLSLGAKLTEFSLFYVFGLFFILYAIFSALAVALSLFDLAEIYNASAHPRNSVSCQKQPSHCCAGSDTISQQRDADGTRNNPPDQGNSDT